MELLRRIYFWAALLLLVLAALDLSYIPSRNLGKAYLGLNSRGGLELGAWPQDGLTVCAQRLSFWDGKLREYLAAHQNRLPRADAQDAFYWLKLVKPRLSPPEQELLYCCQDREQKYPSSFISDPALAGKDLSLLSEPGRVVLLRELGYPHGGKYSGFLMLDGSKHLWTRREARRLALFYPEFPGEKTYWCYGEVKFESLMLGWLVLLLALGYWLISKRPKAG